MEGLLRQRQEKRNWIGVRLVEVKKYLHVLFLSVCERDVFGTLTFLLDVFPYPPHHSAVRSLQAIPYAPMSPLPSPELPADQANRGHGVNTRAPVWRLTPIRVGFAALLAFVGLGGFLWPAFELIRSFFDPALNGQGVPRLARQLHYSLTPRYARWATERTGSQRAAKLSISNVSGTEWPLYGSVFYLWAEEALQAEWERDHSLFPEEPRVFARSAIEAAARLVADPSHAGWVKKYWGDRYLERENVFYRMLLISALASHRRLTGSDEFMPLLRSQTDGLAAELNASRFGLLDDYPGQCYPPM